MGEGRRQRWRRGFGSPWPSATKWSHFGSQSVAARQFGIQELSTTVLTATIVGIGMDSRLAGGTGEREKLRYAVVFTMCGGAVVGATMSEYFVAPVIALAALCIATGLAIFRYGASADPSPV